MDAAKIHFLTGN